MDKEIETTIVKTFFKQKVRDRLLFELFSPKKRKDALSRLSHNYSQVLREEYMVEIPLPNSNYEMITELLKQRGAGTICYVMSWNDELDGKEMLLSEALRQEVGSGMPSLISCIADKLVFFEAEQVQGPPPRYILLRK
jgi:hypothetical protein